MNRQFLNGALLLLASGTVAAGTTAVTGSLIDTQGYDTVTIIASLGAVTSTGVPSLKAQGGDDSGGGDLADLAGAVATGDDTSSNKFLVVSIHRPKHRYIKGILSRTTANTVVNGIIVVLTNASNEPVTQSAVAAKVALVTPAYA